MKNDVICKRIARFSDNWEWLVLDVDTSKKVFGFVPVACNDNGDRLADIAHYALCQDRLKESPRIWLYVLRYPRRQARYVVRSDYFQRTDILPALRDINRYQPRVGVRAAQYRCFHGAQ
jgi:hypothetical protein